MSKNIVDFDFSLNSPLKQLSKFEGIEGIFKLGNKFSNCDEYMEKNKSSFFQILNNHKLLESKREFFSILENQEYIRNSGVALEYFLIDYLGIYLLNKINPEKWEENGIDLFYGNKIGIDLTVENKTSKKERKLKLARDKINKCESFYYTEEDEKGNKYDIPISNKEVPKNVALFKIKSKLIQYLVGNGKQNFLQNINSLNDTSFIELNNDFEIIKNSFPQIIDKINFLINNSFNGIKSNEYHSINYMGGKISGTKSSNIVFKRIDDKESDNHNIIIFKVHSNLNSGTENDDTLIYEFRYYICKPNNREDFIDNSNEKRVQKFWAISKSDGFEHSNNQFDNKLIKLKKLAVQYNEKLKELNKFISSNSFDYKKVEKKYLNDFILGLNGITGSQNIITEIDVDYSIIKSFINDFDQAKKEKFIRDIEILELDNQEIIEFKKDIYWLNSFISKTKSLIGGEDIDFDVLGNGLFKDEDLLFKDPVFIENNFLDRSKKLHNKYINILSLLSKIELDFIDEKLGLVDFDDSDLKKGYNAVVGSSFQKLFFIHTQKFKSAKIFIKNLLGELNNKKEANLKLLSEKNNRKSNSLGRKDKFINNKGGNISVNKKVLKEENNNIDSLIDEIRLFSVDSISIRNDIRGIKFDDLLLKKIYNNRLVFTNKFLSNIIIGEIFNGNTLITKDIKKEELIFKIEDIIDTSNIDLEKFLYLLEFYKNSINIDSKYVSFHNLREDISVFLDLIENNLEEVNISLDDIMDKTYKEKEGNFLFLVKKMENILTGILDVDLIKTNKDYISIFVQNFPKYNIDNFDKYFINLIKKIGLENSKIFQEHIKEYNEFIQILEDIDAINFAEIDESLYDRNTDFDVVQKGLKVGLKELNEKFDELKEQIVFLDKYK